MLSSRNRSLFCLFITTFLIGCEGEVGPQGIGLNSLTNVISEPAGPNCENGGVKIEVGTDANGNGVLDVNEVSSASYVCNGSDGNNSLVSIVTEPAGSNCPNGGVKIESGIDTNGNGSLDETETIASTYVCNGINGSDALTRTTNEPAGMNCENGGIKIESGIDYDRDGILDESEVASTAYICNGNDGTNSLIKVTGEGAGTNCENGGLKIEIGLDDNADGALDNSEISLTSYVCNGLDGSVSLVNVIKEIEGANCEYGGVKIESGVDNNDNGQLDLDEIEATEYVCNGLNRELDSEIIIKFPGSGYAYGASSVSGRLPTEVSLNSFNITSYSEIDSIVFQSYLRTTDASVKCFIELYDITNENVISNTLLTSNSVSDWEWVSTTSNFISSIPASTISLGIRVRTEEEGTSVSFYLPEIRLYRN